MAYSKTSWTDREVQFPNRYVKSGESSGNVTLVNDPGTITKVGTPINAGNMNKIEQALADAHEMIDEITIAMGVSKYGSETYTYNSDDSVQSITEKTVDGTVISATVFTYTADGDVDTSIKTMNGQTVTTQYIYDANGNLTDTVNTKA